MISDTSALRNRYIDLLSNAITMALWEAGDGSLNTTAKGATPTLREVGHDWPKLAHTMIGQKRLSSLRSCVEDVIADDVPGDFIETGVWRGGACILMRGILAAHGITDRTVWVADSFEGLPAPDEEKYPEDSGANWNEAKELAVSLEEVRDTFDRYGLLDDKVQFLKGWFKDTLPAAPIEKLAIARLDGDLYESTWDGLTNLYPKLSVGGYLIIDDYSLPMCKQAVIDYRDEHDITEAIQVIDWTGVYWRREN
jgi:hypothetical protein